MPIITSPLSYPKTDKIPVPTSENPTQYIAATDWNTLCSVVDSVRANAGGGGGGTIAGSIATTQLAVGAATANSIAGSSALTFTGGNALTVGPVGGTGYIAGPSAGGLTLLSDLAVGNSSITLNPTTGVTIGFSGTSIALGSGAAVTGLLRLVSNASTPTLAGQLAFDGTNFKYSTNGSTWTNFGGGGATGNFTFASNTADLAASGAMTIGSTNTTGITLGGSGGTTIATGANSISLTPGTSNNIVASNSILNLFTAATNGFSIQSTGIYSLFGGATIYVQDGTGIYPNTDLTRTSGTPTNRWSSVSAGLYVEAVGTAIASAATIAPTRGITHITGTAAVATITVPVSGFTGTITLIPDGAFTTTTAGNIALASTAIVNRMMRMTYDSGTSKWYPSY